MQFPLPVAPVMLRFPQQKYRTRSQHATLTQKPGDNKRKGIQQNPELTINKNWFKKRIIKSLNDKA
jgi:hypothetical protein